MIIFEQMVEIFSDSTGKEPFKSWLKSIASRNTLAVIFNRINRLKLGNFGDCKNLSGGIYELRIDIGPGYRIYFAKTGINKIIILSGGTKKTQFKDIRKAKQYLEKFRRMHI